MKYDVFSFRSPGLNPECLAAAFIKMKYADAVNCPGIIRHFFKVQLIICLVIMAISLNVICRSFLHKCDVLEIHAVFIIGCSDFIIIFVIENHGGITS